MNRRVGLIFGVVIVGLAIIANDQKIYSNDFMSNSNGGVGRLDDESIERALASTTQVPATNVEVAENEIPSNDLIERPTLPELESVASGDNNEEETGEKPSDLGPVTLYLFEAYVPTKEKVNGKEIEKMVYYNSDPQFSNDMPTVQGTLEYQYNFDDQGVSRTVLMLEANYSSTAISIGPILIKDRSNVYYLDEEGNPINGQMLTNTSRGEETLEFSTGPYRQYRFVFCADLMKCSEQRSRELEKKDTEAAEQFDVVEPESSFETKEVIEADQQVEQPEVKVDENQQDNESEEMNTQESSEDKVVSDQEQVEDSEKVNLENDDAAIEARDQNAVNTEGDFEGFINSKVESSEESDVDQEQKSDETTVETEQSAYVPQNEYVKQSQEDVVAFTDAQIESDKKLRFSF